MLERMKKANEEHIISTYFLTEEQQEAIEKGLIEYKDNKFDLLDLV